jgi:YbbR domain-containing protein
MISRLGAAFSTANVVRYLLSFVLAFTLWAWVTAQRDPEQTYQANQLAITATNLADSLNLVGSLPTVDVRLEGPQSVIETIDTGSIQATIDLAGADIPGAYERDVQVTAPEGLRNIEVTPETVIVELDAVVSKTFPVEVLSPESVPRNLAVTDTNAVPSEVTVTGVQRNVDRVARVLVDVSLSGQEESFTTQAIPRPVDAENRPVDNVSIAPSTVSLSVAIEVRGKEIPVFVRCECDAADGFEVVGQPLPTPGTVLIDGPRDLLNDVQYIYTTPIVTSTLEAPEVLPDVPLDTSTLPEGVSIEQTTVDVSVRVEQATFSQTFDGVEISVLNALEGTKVTVSPDAISITVEGPRSEVSALTSDDVDVVVDVEDRGPGTYQIVPRVILPPRVRYSDPPAPVTVTIVAPAPTATAEPVATPAAEPSPTP